MRAAMKDDKEDLKNNLKGLNEVSDNMLVDINEHVSTLVSPSGASGQD